MTPGERPPVEGQLEAIEAELQRCLELLPPAHHAMAEMVRHHFGWRPDDPAPSGKRLRPRLTLLSAASVGGDWRQALPAAAAVELVHNFSLIHDDIQDASETRRGRETVWRRWGVPQAINTGDFVLVAAHLACRRLSELGVSAERAFAALQRLDQACLELTQGQHLDLAFETRSRVTTDEYLEMISGKTAALLAASAGLGALLGGADPQAQGAHHRFGWNLGMAFQLLDDLLGIWGQPDQTGKSAADDLRQRKKTYPVLFGLSQSAEFARLWQGGPAGSPQVAALQRSLDDTEARQQTRRMASDFTTQALEALRSAPRRGPAGEDLESLAQGLLDRDR